jgi:hypothetical protein
VFPGVIQTADCIESTTCADVSDDPFACWAAEHSVGQCRKKIDRDLTGPV